MRKNYAAGAEESIRLATESEYTSRAALFAEIAKTYALLELAATIKETNRGTEDVSDEVRPR